MHLFFLPDVLGKFVGQMLKNMLEEARRHFDDKVYEAWSHPGGFRHSDMAVVIEGHSLHVALETANRETFLRLCQLCRTVVCCRVTPVQKVQVCSLLRCC
jgi:magnesium-transporting ATPase (P-type)